MNFYDIVKSPACFAAFREKLARIPGLVRGCFRVSLFREGLSASKEEFDCNLGFVEFIKMYLGRKKAHLLAYDPKATAQNLM